MDRRKFLKRFGAGSAITLVAPLVVGNMIIDIPNDPLTHSCMSIEDILRIWKECGVLPYRPTQIGNN